VRCPPAPPDDDPDSSPVFALLGNKYTPGGIATPPPTNYCAVSMIPVLGYEGATGADYQRLLQGGSLLEYTDAGACKACTDTGGQCRVDVSDDAFKCYCYNRVNSATCGEFVQCHSDRGYLRFPRISGYLFYIFLAFQIISRFGFLDTLLLLYI